MYNIIIKLLINCNFMVDDKQNNNDSLSKDQAKELAQTHGKKLGFLLAAAEIPDEIKQSWLALLPEMSLQQIDELVEILETNYLHSATKEVDEELKKKLKTIQEQYEQEIDQTNKQALDALEKLGQDLTKAQK